MYFEITEEMKKVPNDWVLLDENKNLIDRDDNLCLLLGRHAGIQRYTVTKNWFKEIRRCDSCLAGFSKEDIMGNCTCSV